MVDGGIALVILADDHSLRQRQRQAEVDFVLVEDLGFELDAILDLVEVFPGVRIG